MYDAGRLPDGRVFFTMKEVRAQTYGKVLREVHQASVVRWERSPTGCTFHKLVAALHQASQAVAYAHDRGVVHRHLKPSNVMVGDHGEVQVMDWGLCKVVGRPEPRSDAEAVVVERDRHATRSGAVMGTPAYMAPEQARGDLDAIDAGTDVYALGAMLYEVLTGGLPNTWSVFRGGAEPSCRFPNLGFRLVRDFAGRARGGRGRSPWRVTVSVTLDLEAAAALGTG